MACCNISTAVTLSTSDRVRVYQNSSCTGLETTLGTILTLFKANYVDPSFTENITTPADGFNLVIASNSTNSWQIINPTGAIATATITLPLNTDAVDGQEIIVSGNLAMTAITIALNGATAAKNVPSGTAAGESFKIRFNKTTNTWWTI